MREIKCRGRKPNGEWIYGDLVTTETTDGIPTKKEMLIPARTDTNYWHEWIFPHATHIDFVRGRIKFGNSKNSAPFPSAVVVFENTDY